MKIIFSAFYFQNYQESLNDLNKVLLLDSDIVEAKMELEEVTRFLSIKDNTASFSKEKERRKIEIQEVFGFNYLHNHSFGGSSIDSKVILMGSTKKKKWVFILMINEEILTNYKDRLFLCRDN